MRVSPLGVNRIQKRRTCSGADGRKAPASKIAAARAWAAWDCRSGAAFGGIVLLLALSALTDMNPLELIGGVNGPLLQLFVRTRRLRR